MYPENSCSINKQTSQGTASWVICTSGHRQAREGTHRQLWFRQKTKLSQQTFLAAAGGELFWNWRWDYQPEMQTATLQLISKDIHMPQPSLFFLPPRKLAPLRTQKAVFEIHFFLHLAHRGTIVQRNVANGVETKRNSEATEWFWLMPVFNGVFVCKKGSGELP